MAGLHTFYFSAFVPRLTSYYLHTYYSDTLAYSSANFLIPLPCATSESNQTSSRLQSAYCKLHSIFLLRYLFPAGVRLAPKSSFGELPPDTHKALIPSISSPS